MSTNHFDNYQPIKEEYKPTQLETSIANIEQVLVRIELYLAELSEHLNHDETEDEEDVSDS